VKPRFVTGICISIFIACFFPAFSQEEQNSVVTIEQALKTSYVKDEKQNTEIIKFSGNVVVSVVKGGKKTIIRADTINFDRKRNELYAEGGVVLEQFESGNSTQTLTAQSVLFNTATLEGIFYDSKAVQRRQESVKLPEGSTLIVFSDYFAKDRSDVITFKNGQLTFCDDENPHWKIKASRIWLLPGNEFAFANALLYVGAVPLMYFPFFYYPKDELFFNPSFGYRAREGYFVQTTTYFMGRKALTQGSDSGKGFNFMQPSSLYEQELDGLVLHNLNTEASMPPYFLKFMADYYSTLGGMTGIAGDFKFNTFFKSLSFDVRLGFSNTIYPVPGYTQYISYSSQNRKHADFGLFFGMRLPFRYAASFKTSAQAGGFSLSVALPLYSDPKFARDFSDRKESMDWIDFFLKGAFSGAGRVEDVASSSSSSSVSTISSYTWDIAGSYTPSLDSLRPLLDSFSISSFNSSVLFSSYKIPKTTMLDSVFAGDGEWYDNSPNQDFFYPIQIKPLAFSVSASGTLFEWPPKERKKKEPSERGQAAQKLMSVPETFASGNTADAADAQTEQNAQTEQSTKTAQTADSAVAKTDSLFADTTLPNIDIPKPASAQNEALTYKLSYTFRPNFSSLLTFSPIKTAGGSSVESTDFSLAAPKSSEVSIKAPLDITGSLAWYGSVLSLTNALSFSPQYQTHPILSGTQYTASEREKIVLNDYASRKTDITNTNALTVKPLVFFPVFKNSSVSWNTGVKLLQSSFTGTADNPEWTYYAPKWDEKTLTSHNVNVTLATQEDAFSQTFSIQANLPPLVDSYTGKLEFAFPAGRTSLEAGYKKRDLSSGVWYFAPLVQSSSWSLFQKTRDGKDNKNKLNFAQRFEYNINDKHSERFDAALSWRNFRVSYEMLYTYSYTLNTTTGWVSSSEKKFLPYALSASLNTSSVEFTNKAKTISIKPSVSSALSWNIVKPTDSYFNFSPSLALKINDFLTLTFSAESRNKELLRYMQKAIGFTPEIPGERNVFVDLWNSFAFWDESKRASSGFKLKHINIKLEHDLHDWTLKSEFKVEPRIIQVSPGVQKYDYKPYFTLSVQWKPMQGIRTVIKDEYGNFILNPAS
jgi:hypothetical protein